MSPATKKKLIAKLTADQLEALAEYKSQAGRNWKSELRLDWQTGRDCNALRDDRGRFLRQVRNTNIRVLEAL